jgi:hypothetical protein
VVGASKGTSVANDLCFSAATRACGTLAELNKRDCFGGAQGALVGPKQFMAPKLLKIVAEYNLTTFDFDPAASKTLTT